MGTLTFVAVVLKMWMFMSQGHPLLLASQTTWICCSSFVGNNLYSFPLSVANNAVNGYGCGSNCGFPKYFPSVCANASLYRHIF